MKASFYPLRKCWRVQIPAQYDETGARRSKYFKTRVEADDFIARLTGTIPQKAQTNGDGVSLNPTVTVMIDAPPGVSVHVVRLTKEAI